MKEIILIILAVITLGSAIFVSFSRNMIYSAFTLLLTFSGVAGLFSLLGADFIAGVQLLIYVGGIMILIIFAVMLTQNISEGKKNNLYRYPLTGLILSLGFLSIWIDILWSIPWETINQPYTPMSYRLGDSFLTENLFPFEMISVLLLVGLIGAVSIVRIAQSKEQVDVSRGTDTMEVN